MAAIKWTEVPGNEEWLGYENGKHVASIAWRSRQFKALVLDGENEWREAVHAYGYRTLDKLDDLKEHLENDRNMFLAEAAAPPQKTGEQ